MIQIPLSNAAIIGARAENVFPTIMLTMRAIDENGKWLPKSRKVYDLDENGERIRLPSGNWKSHKEDTVDWNEQYHAEEWRHGWELVQNKYLELAGSPERVDMRSYERQGLDKIPTVHMGAAVCALERKGIETNIGNLNRDIKAANRMMNAIRSTIQNLRNWIVDIVEATKEAFAEVEAQPKSTSPDLVSEAREDDPEFQSPVDLMFERLEQKDPDHFAVRQYKKFLLSAGKTRSSILISCGARLAPFDIREVRELMEDDEMELDTIGDEKTVLFLIMSDTDTTFNFILAMLQSQLINLPKIPNKQFCEPQNAAESEDIYGIFQQCSEHFADDRDRTGRRPVRLGRRQSSGGLRPGQPRR